MAGKLVRDKIPEIMKAAGQTPVFRRLDKAEYKICLERKLEEETAEYLADKNLEELADILEVLWALAEADGYSKEELLAACADKHEKRGGFAQRIFLEESRE